MGMKSRTNVGLRLKHGKDSKVFRASFISNQPFTESEFQKWKYTCETDNVDLPTMKQVEEREKAIQKALTYRFSNADVEKILVAKQKFQKNPKNYAVFKAKLMKDKVQATDEGKTEEVEELDRRLAELEERAEELDKKRTGSLSNISFINDRNRKGNVMRAEKGITEDIERKKREGDVDDPFTRRKTRPVMKMPKAKDQIPTSELLMKLEQERMGTEEVSTQEKENKVQKNNEDLKGGNKASAGNGDIFNAHDFDIDIKIGGEGGPPVLTSMAVKPVHAGEGARVPGGKKNSIKIDEWKKRRGML